MLLQAYTYAKVNAGEARSWMHDRFIDLTKSERGATAAEYGVLVALIAAVIIAGATLLGSNVNTKLSNVGTTVGSAS